MVDGFVGAALIHCSVVVENIVQIAFRFLHRGARIHQAVTVFADRGLNLAALRVV
jgi:hypothetical protein